MGNLKTPYLVWRDGRPRWEPGPKLRRLGFHGRDLKDGAGAWLSLGAAIDAARALNTETDKVPTPVIVAVPRTMNAAFDAYLARRRTNTLGHRTVRNYNQHIRLLRGWCGDRPAAELDPGMVEDFYTEMVEARGLAQANAVIRTLKVVVYYMREKQRWTTSDPASWLDEMKLPEGRLVLWEMAEIAAFVAWADAAGLAHQGDAAIIGLTTGLRQGDILSLPPIDAADNYFVVRVGKTKRKAFVPRTELLDSRLAKMAARKQERWPNVVFSHTILNSRGKPYTGDPSRFMEQFRLVRALAAGVPEAVAAIGRVAFPPPPKVGEGDREAVEGAALPTIPSILDKHFADLRDTAVTWLFAAGCSVAEIATITGHSLKTVQAILDKHYFVRNAELALAAGGKLDAWLSRQGVRL